MSVKKCPFSPAEVSTVPEGINWQQTFRNNKIPAYF